MWGSTTRAVLLALFAATFTTACLLYKGSPISGNMFIKEMMALRVLMFGSSAILIVIWYYLCGLRTRRRKRRWIEKREADL